MDTIIFLMILAAFLVVVRGAERAQVLSVWAASLLAMLLLFNHHVTSSLNLSF